VRVKLRLLQTIKSIPADIWDFKVITASYNYKAHATFQGMIPKKRRMS
jgi:hypothetical protein